MLSVKLLSSSKSEQRPVTAQYVTDILSSSSSFDSSELIRRILEDVQKKSSKHKFLVNVTKITSSDDSECSAASNFGAVWDSEKDGYYSFEVLLEEHKSTIVSIYWVYIS